VTTQDPIRQRAVIVPDKAQRVAQFHGCTVDALAEIVATAGLEHPTDLTPAHLCRRTDFNMVQTAAEFYNFLEPGQLLEGDDSPLHPYWSAANPARFGLSS